MNCEVIPGLHSSCRLARGLEHNGFAGREMCCVISLDNLSPEAEGTVVVFLVIHTVLELPSAGYRGGGGCLCLGGLVIVIFVALVV